MNPIDLPSSPPGKGDGEQPSANRDGSLRRGSSIGIALASALLAAATTTCMLWLAGAFDLKVIRITEIVERTEVVQVPASVAPPPHLEEAPSPPLPEPPPETTVPLFAPTNLVAVVATRAIPSIVTVQTFDEEFGRLASGSGVIISPDGFIVTNDHVVEDADTLKIVMSDGLSYPAELVGTDPLMDIAVLKVEARQLVAIEFASMEGVQTGEPAIAVGNPLGLDGGPSVTAGVISAFNRTLVTDFVTGQSLYGLLQTDAPITRGSSGGALLDVHGRLLGITTAIGLSDVGAEGLGFAVPVNLVEGIVNDLMAEGEVRHAFLGIRGSSAFTEREDGAESPLGVEIILLDDSAIGDAGAEDGDVIVALDGRPVRSMPLLVARLRSYRAGDPVKVTMDRAGRTVEIDMVLDQYPS